MTKKQKTIKILGNILFPLAVVTVVLAVWTIAALALNVDLILPTPSMALSRFFEMFGEAAFWGDIANTMLRALYSFVVSFVLSLVLAVISALSVTAKRLISPLVAIVRAVPTMSIILLLIIWLSPSFAPAVVAVVVICPTLYSSFLAAIESVDTNLLQMSKVYKVSKKDIVLKLYLPNMAPQLFENTASGFSLNLKLVIAAETLAQTAHSIGKSMQFAKIAIETTDLFALTVAAVLLGVFAEVIIRFVGKKVVKWQT